MVDRARRVRSAPLSSNTVLIYVLRRWIIMFCTFGFANSFGVFQDFYVRQGGFSSSTISWIGSVQLCLLFAGGFPAGRLFDRGYFHHIQIVGGLLYVFS